MTVTEDFPGVK